MECVLFIRDATPTDRLYGIMVTNGCVNLWLEIRGRVAQR
jgi:hypothetical protein